MRGVDLCTVAKLMGHSSIDIVVRVYGHLSSDHKRRAMAQLGAGLGSLHLKHDAA
jgi:integrase